MRRAAKRKVSLHAPGMVDPEESGIRSVCEAQAVSEAIANGGMASVHLVAKDQEEGRLYVLKRLHPHLANDEYFMSMLYDEAMIAASVRHENVVTTYGIESYEGKPCVVMEYVPGCSALVVAR